MRSSKVLIVVLAAAAAGCGTSPPTQFYTLSTVPPSQAVPSGTAPAPLTVDAVTVPPELDRMQIVRRADPNRIDIAGFDRWGAPIDEEIRRTLWLDLAARLPPGSVIAPQAPAPKDLRHVAVEIARFEGDLAGHIELWADWSITGGAGTPVLRQERITLDAPAPGVAGTVAGMSEALGKLADRIARSWLSAPPAS